MRLFVIVFLCNLLYVANVFCDEHTVKQIQSIVGEEYEVKYLPSQNIIRILSKDKFDGKYTGVSADENEQPKLNHIIMWCQPIPLMKDESVKNIAIINEKLKSEIDKIERDIWKIPQEPTKAPRYKYRFNPRNEEEVALVGLYRALCSAVREVPNAKHGDEYLVIEMVSIEYTSDTIKKKCSELLRKLRNL